MKSLDERLSALRAVGAPERVHALAAWLDACEPGERGAIMRELFGTALRVSREATVRARPPGVVSKMFGSRAHAAPEDCAAKAWQALAWHWAWLSAEVSAEFRSLGAPHWAAALREIGPASPLVARQSVVRLAGEFGSVEFASACVALLGDADVPTAAAAGRALAAIARGAIEHNRVRDPDLERTVVAALSTFVQHRNRGTLAAAMALLTPAAIARGGPLRDWFVDPAPDEARAALRGALRAERGTLGADRAWEWLKLDGFDAHASERLAAIHDDAERRTVMARSVLVRNPARGARLDLVQVTRAGVAGILPSGVLDDSSPEERRGLARLARPLCASAAVRCRYLDPLLGDADPGVRYAASRSVAPEDLVDYCFDADERVARSAVLTWSAVGELGLDGRPLSRHGARTSPARVGLLMRLLRSPHASVRGIARQELSAADWLNDCSCGGRTTARAAWGADRAGVIEKLRAALLDNDAGRALGAIATARRLGAVPELQGELVRAAGPARVSARAAASAVIALADLGHGRAVELVRPLLRDADDRVRANAVEALAIAARRSGEQLAGWADEAKLDPHHRVRANAIAATLFGTPAAAGLVEFKLGRPEHGTPDAVGSMLDDARPMHRLAGVWLAGRVLGAVARRDRGAVGAVEQRLVRMTDADPEPAVRRRAAWEVRRDRWNSRPRS